MHLRAHCPLVLGIALTLSAVVILGLLRRIAADNFHLTTFAVVKAAATAGAWTYWGITRRLAGRAQASDLYAEQEEVARASRELRSASRRL